MTTMQHKLLHATVLRHRRRVQTSQQYHDANSRRLHIWLLKNSTHVNFKLWRWSMINWSWPAAWLKTPQKHYCCSY